MIDPNININNVPWRSVLKASSLISLAPFMLITLLVFYGYITIYEAIYAMLFSFILSVIFVYPYVKNLWSLTNYVKLLALDKKAEAPDLSFLNNVDELSEAVAKLHSSWEVKRRKLELMVQESNILIDSLPDCLIMLDKNQKTVQVNSQMRTIFGGNSKKLNDNIKNITGNHDISLAINDVIEGKKVPENNISFYMNEPYNTHYIVRVGAFPTDSISKIAVIIMMHDISEQKRTEALLSDFVANASHEIRTPLTSIMGFVETLQTSAKDDPKAQQKFLKIINEQAMRMSSLVNGLLSLAQIERNKNTVIEDKTFRIKPIINDVILRMNDLATEKNIVIDINIAKNIPAIKGTKNEIIQVVENLTNNAIKYGNENSTITINADIKDNIYDYPILQNHDKIIVISFADEGIGVDKKHINRLTERFYRVDNARSRDIGGTGLGLSIVKHILNRHNAALHIESTKNKGSVFSVLLPFYSNS